MAGERFSVAHIDQPLEQFERVVERLSGIEPADNAEGEQRGGAATEIFLRQRVIGIVGKARIVDPGYTRVGAQEFGDAAAILHMALDTQRHRLDALQQEKRGKRGQHGAGGAPKDAAAARDVGGVAEALGIDQAVIGCVRLVEFRKARGMSALREAAGIDDGAAERGAVTAQKFGQRMSAP